MTELELENLYKEIYMEYYDDNEMAAELSVFNAHPHKIQDFENMIIKLVNHLLNIGAIDSVSELACELERPESNFAFMDKTRTA